MMTGVENGSAANLEITVDAEAAAIASYAEAVAQNPLDFNSWKELLALLEKEASIEIDVIRNTFDRFLTEFPLCYGYWNKLAELEKKHAQQAGQELAVIDATVRGVYERGVVAVRYSPDMWLNYINYLLTLGSASDAQNLRSVFERALEAVGSDPSSTPLWEKYIAFEGTQNDGRLVELYKRSFYSPLNNLEALWQHFVTHCGQHPLKELASEAERHEISSGTNTPLTNEETLKGHLVAKYEAVKQATLAEAAKRYTFEQGIRRPYFHVKPLEEYQLANWRAYLDFEEAEKDSKKIEQLFERCLVACANYAEFWIRYATWKESQEGAEAANAIYVRGTSVFLKYRSDIHLAYADFLEYHGHAQEARAVYQHTLWNIAKGLVEGLVKFSNFERRQGNIDAAITIISDALPEAVGDSHAYLALQLARIQELHLRDVEKARETLRKATATWAHNKVLWLSRAEFELQHPKQKDVASRVDEIFVSALSSNNHFSEGDRADIMQAHLDFLEDFGSDLTRLIDLRRSYQRSSQVLKSGSRKRGAEDGAYDGGAAKQPRYDASGYYQQPTSYQGYGYDAQQQSTGYQASYDATAYSQAYTDPTAQSTTPTSASAASYAAAYSYPQYATAQ